MSSETKLAAREALTEVLAFMGAPSDGVSTLADDDICPIKAQVSGAHLKRWHAALSAPTRDAEGERLREQVDTLTAALAEAMVICARHSPGGVAGLRAALGADGVG